MALAIGGMSLGVCRPVEQHPLYVQMHDSCYSIVAGPRHLQFKKCTSATMSPKCIEFVRGFGIVEQDADGKHSRPSPKTSHLADGDVRPKETAQAMAYTCAGVAVNDFLSDPFCQSCNHGADPLKVRMYRVAVGKFNECHSTTQTISPGLPPQLECTERVELKFCKTGTMTLQYEGMAHYRSYYEKIKNTTAVSGHEDVRRFVAAKDRPRLTQLLDDDTSILEGWDDCDFLAKSRLLSYK